jgi:hypothetical protein
VHSRSLMERTAGAEGRRSHHMARHPLVAYRGRACVHGRPCSDRGCLSGSRPGRTRGLPQSLCSHGEAHPGGDHRR